MIRRNEKIEKSGKVLIACKNIQKEYEDFSVLNGISFSIYRHEKIGLVGVNGAGKSTLMKIIAGLEKPDDGMLNINATVGYVPQEISGSEKIFTAKELLQKEHTTNIYNEAVSILRKLGAPPDILDKTISNLSGGEKSKITVVRIMLAPADVLLLDEPTNNLDLPALAFLENFIEKSNKAFLIISHDRKFLDRTVNKIIEIDEFARKSVLYDGNFSAYLEERGARTEREGNLYTDQIEKREKIKKSAEEKLKRMRNVEKVIKNKGRVNAKILEIPANTILRGKAGKAGKQSRILKDKLEKTIADEQIEKPHRKISMKLNFETDERSGVSVFNIVDVVKQTGGVNFDSINMSIQYGDRILIVGPNGAGKTTFIKMLLGELVPDSGQIKRGTRLHIGYLPQEENFKENNSVKKQFMEDTKGMKEGDVRRTLNRFGLSTEDVQKKIKDISPGERSRLILAIMMTKKVNCLILDEPSNHLDIEALEQLEQALKDFSGTLILISHDRYFIDNVNIQKTYLLEDGKLEHIMDYHAYEHHVGLQ